MQFLTTLDWSPFFLSLKTGVIATCIAFFVGIFVAYLMMHVTHKVKWILDGILTLPLVLPPTVVGFFLLLIFSLKRPFGAMLYNTFHIRIVQSLLGCMIAACVIAFPLMYRNARAAFEQVDITFIHAARTLGMSEIEIFWRIVMPISKPGILSGTILSFARALGEYGATSMLAGNIAGKTKTIAITIATEVAGGNYELAGFWVIVMMILSLTMIVMLNVWSEKYSNQGKGVARWRWK